MNRRYFGTDGIRGPYGGPVINESFVSRLGAAVGRWLKGRLPAGASPLVLIGRDTRASGPALARALAAGLASEGRTARSLGVLPTPALARAMRRPGASLGVMITASHNPACDNGIKFFRSGGAKLTDAEELQIESLLPGAADPAWLPPGLDDGEGGGAIEDYVAAEQAILPAGSLRGWRIVVDTANGAACATSPRVFRSLGAEVVGVGDAPDGRNINAGVGGEHPEKLSAAVRAAGARLGVAHDGDGDRCILCDEAGGILDGDEILAILATHALKGGHLAARTLVVTVHSNGGLDEAVAALGGRVVRTSVGDRYVAEAMAAAGASLGGESSGHIILPQISPSADGLAAALKVIEVMRDTGLSLSELRRVLVKYPQATTAVAVKEKRPLEGLSGLREAIRAVEAQTQGRGRVLVRYSGTESKLRILVEARDQAAARAGLSRIETAARAELEAV